MHIVDRVPQRILEYFFLSISLATRNVCPRAKLRTVIVLQPLINGGRLVHWTWVRDLLSGPLLLLLLLLLLLGVLPPLLLLQLLLHLLLC